MFSLEQPAYRRCSKPIATARQWLGVHLACFRRLSIWEIIPLWYFQPKVTASWFSKRLHMSHILSRWRHSDGMHEIRRSIILQYCGTRKSTDSSTSTYRTSSTRRRYLVEYLPNSYITNAQSYKEFIGLIHGINLSYIILWHILLILLSTNIKHT